MSKKKKNDIRMAILTCMSVFHISDLLLGLLVRETKICYIVVSEHLREHLSKVDWSFGFTFPKTFQTNEQLQDKAKYKRLTKPVEALTILIH